MRKVFYISKVLGHGSPKDTWTIQKKKVDHTIRYLNISENKMDNATNPVAMQSQHH